MDVLASPAIRPMKGNYILNSHAVENRVNKVLDSRGGVNYNGNMTKASKGSKVEGKATVMDHFSTLRSYASGENVGILFNLGGSQYSWVTSNGEALDLCPIGKTIILKAFSRENHRLYRVSISEVA